MRPRRGGWPGSEARLRELEANEAAAAAAREQAERTRSQAEAARAAAQREAELAAQRDGETAALLASALDAAGFADGQEAREALRSAERQAGSTAIGAYEQEGERLKGRQAALEQQLAGRSISAEEWQAWGTGWSRPAGSPPAAGGAGAGVQVRDDLLAKQQRWQELEERGRAGGAARHLEELQQGPAGQRLRQFHGPGADGAGGGGRLPAAAAAHPGPVHAGGGAGRQLPRAGRDQRRRPCAR